MKLLQWLAMSGSLTITSTWNTKSQLTQQVSPRGLKNVLAYDTLGRVTGISYLDAANATAFPALGFTYDILDRTATTTDGEGTTTYAYDAAARLQSVDGPYANDTVSYTFDAQSRADTVTTPGGVTQSFGFDADGRLSSWTDVFGSGSMTYSGHTGRVLGVSRAGGLLTTSLAYTAVTDLQKLAQIKHESGGSVVSQFDYTWSAQQDLATWTRKLGGTTDRETRYEFAHDAAHQLTAATLKQTSNNAVVADGRWGVDSIGNRILDHDLVTGIRTEYTHSNTNALVDKKVYSNNQKPWVQGSVNEPASVALGGKPLAVKGDGTFQGQGPSRTTTINAADAAGNPTNETWQLNNGSGATPDSTTTFTHDAEGNLLGDGTSTFEWDLKNRLTAIVTGTHRTEYTYDGADRRVRVIEKDNGTVTSDKRRVYHGLSLLEERAADNTTVLRRFYGGGHVDVADGGKRYAYTTDHLGSIREVMLLDGTTGNPTTATLTARYDYDTWGKRTILDGGTPAETLTLSGYTGHEYHQLSGLWLAPFRAYSPALGRWISRDPIGEAGGINLFAYVSNAPDVATDPLGWCDSPNSSVAGAGGGSGWGGGGAAGSSLPPPVSDSPQIILASTPPEDSRSSAERFVDWITGGAASAVKNKPELTAENAAKELAKTKRQALESGGATLRSGKEVLTQVAASAVFAGFVAKTGGELIRGVAGMAGTPAEKAGAITAGADALGLTFTPVANVSGGWRVFVGITPAGADVAPLLAINPITGQVLKGTSKALSTGASGMSYLNAAALNLVK